MNSLATVAAEDSSWAQLALNTLVRLAAVSAGRKLTILAYHRVLPSPDAFHVGTPDAALFERLMRLVASQYRVISLEEGVARLRRRCLQPGSVAITFDDGYADNATVAVPVLRRLGLTATFFVATDFLDGGRMWNDTIKEAVRLCPGAQLDLSRIGLGIHDLGTLDRRIGTANRLIDTLKYRDPAARDDAVATIAACAGIPLLTDLMMTTEQLLSVRSSGMSVGAHTRSHPILSRLEEPAARREINGSKEVLQDILREPVTLFAYPNGKPGTDYNRSHVEMVRAAGFSAAVTTVAGVGTASADVFQLPRYTPWRTRPAHFSAQLVRNFLRSTYQVA